MTRRVVVTGIGLVSPIGNSLKEASKALREDRHGIAYQPDWERIGQLQTKVGGVVRDISFEGRWPRKKARSMGRVARLAAVATDDAILDAGLSVDELTSGRLGIAYGSTHGSSLALEEFCRSVFGKDSFAEAGPNQYLQFMSNTCAANLAHLYEIRGRVLSTCAACVSGSQAIGEAYHMIKGGRQDVMIAGGAEELHWVPAGIFDVFYGASHSHNHHPERTPRPFDVGRDGLVVGEGAGTLVLEDYERARARNATIHAEVLAYGTNCDGNHVTAPTAAGMAACIRLALDEAKLSRDRIDYINAHATATLIGDVFESQATFEVLGDHTPISSTKGFTGHTLGACGAIEAAFCIAMMHDRFLAPTRNLETPDPNCAPLAYIRDAARSAQPKITMSNNFAFGGVNTSLILGTV